MITISVAYATPSRQVEIPLRVEENCTLALAIQRSGVLGQFPEIELGSLSVGIFGQLAALDDLLEEGDRVEIYRPLRTDPKQARFIRVGAHLKCAS